MGEYFLLSHSDKQLLDMFDSMLKSEDSPFKSQEDFLAFIHRRREQHPYYVDRLPGQTSELTIQRLARATRWRSESVQ
jgi:hypothetical protein